MRSKFPTQKQPGGNKTRAQGVGSNNCVVKSSRTADIGITNGAGAVYYVSTLDPLNSGIVTLPVASIAGAYEFYRIRSATVEWVPSGGFSQAGSAQWAFINNPELIHLSATGSDADRSNIVVNEQGVSNISWAAGGSKTYQNNRVTSRRWYSCNRIVDNTIADYDRSIACMLGMRVVGPANTAVPGKLVFHITYEFSGLGNSGSVTAVRTASGPSFPYDTSDGGWPDKVSLYSRVDGLQTYSKDGSGGSETFACAPGELQLTGSD